MAQQWARMALLEKPGWTTRNDLIGPEIYSGPVFLWLFIIGQNSTVGMQNEQVLKDF